VVEEEVLLAGFHEASLRLTVSGVKRFVAALVKGRPLPGILKDCRKPS
jgi:hypothetical protein